MYPLTYEIKGYIVKVCQLGLMGYHTDGITKKANFDPNVYIDRAQFGTILSRLLYGDQNNGGTPFYSNHLSALHAVDIMTSIANPFMLELREYVMIMLMRAGSK